MERKYLTPDEAAKFLNKTKQSLRNYRRRGILRAAKVSTYSIYYSIEELEKCKKRIKVRKRRNARIING